MPNLIMIVSLSLSRRPVSLSLCARALLAKLLRLRCRHTSASVRHFLCQLRAGALACLLIADCCADARRKPGRKYAGSKYQRAATERTCGQCASFVYVLFAYVYVYVYVTTSDLLSTKAPTERAHASRQMDHMFKACANICARYCGMVMRNIYTIVYGM